MLAALHEAVEQKMSASKIAESLNNRFGLSLSRNSVIGKCYRIGIRLMGKSKAAMRNQKRAQPSAPKPFKPSRQSLPERGGAGGATTAGNRNARPLLARSGPPQMPSQMPFPMQPDPAPALCADRQPNTILSLPLSGACKWAISGEGKHMRFCGHVAVIDGPYCEHHAGRAMARAGKQEVTQ